jgi:hypothetical protein
MTCCEKICVNKIIRIRVELSSFFMFYEAHCTCEKAKGFLNENQIFHSRTLIFLSFLFKALKSCAMAL